MVRQFEKHNQLHPGQGSFIVLYDDFNPFLDRFVSRVGPNRPIEKVLSQWKLWDHMDAILSLAVTQLVDHLIGNASRSRLQARLTRPQARDLAILAACYDQSTAESFPHRFRKLRARIGYRAIGAIWPTALGVTATVLLAVAIVMSFRRGQFDWLSTWWPWLLVASAWIPWFLRRATSWWSAWKIVRSMRMIVQWDN